ncbi:MAG: CPBP family intramembrane metalloprotease [Firmicutes bacterium]|nr:CPBP family intramembrane metalloprotease [Bacillota bacterium]
MLKIFRNNNLQIRGGWKIIMSLGLPFILLIGIGSILNLLNIKDPYGISLFIAIFLGVFIILKFIDKKPFKYIGVNSLKKNFNNFSFGLLGGAIFITLNIGLLLILNDASIKGSIQNPNFTFEIIKGILLFIIVALAEEILFRGYIITALQQMKKWWLSGLVSAIIFSLTHGALNDNVSYIAVINLFLAGLLLSYMFIRTKNIWMCVGFHITWNYFQGYIFGIAVSGRKVGKALYTINISDNFLAGGAFGLEGGVVNTVMFLLAFLYVYFFTKKIKDIKKVKIDG